jgi:anti-sigma B factor antagonist
LANGLTRDPLEMHGPQDELIDSPFGFSAVREDVWPAALIRVVGELDIAGAPRLGVMLSEALRERPARLVIDLNKLELLDSTGLSVLLNARRRAIRAGVELSLVCDVQATLRLLEITRLDRDFNVFASVEAALAAP